MTGEKTKDVTLQLVVRVPASVEDNTVAQQISDAIDPDGWNWDVGYPTVAASRPALRKRTVFEPCDYHQRLYAAESVRRRAEVMVEGGWPSPCVGRKCQMKPGTDLYEAGFVRDHPTYEVGGS